MAKEQKREFVTADPHTFYPDALGEFIHEMEVNGWDRGQDDEELFELAMHPEQYRNYKSGKAKENFEKDLLKAKEANGDTNACKSISEASESDKAAVAVAVYLYMESLHDKESGVLTIKRQPSRWDFELNPRM